MSTYLPMDLTDVDKAIIAELRKGDRTQGSLVDFTEYPRYKVHERLSLLSAASYIEKVHEPTALYTLVNDPDHEDTETNS